MTPGRLLSRRVFLRWLLLLAAAPLMNRLRLLRWFGAIDRDEPMVRKLTGVFRHTASAATVGAAYLRQRPEEAPQRRLVELVTSADSRLRRQLTSAREAHVRRLLEQRHQADLAESRTVLINGWIVSVTEARLCALVALSASRG